MPHRPRRHRDAGPRTAWLIPDGHGASTTSVIIDLARLDPEHLPIESAVSAITMAELAAGPHATQDPDKRASESLIAATALSTGLPLYTRNPDAFQTLHELVDVVHV